MYAIQPESATPRWMCGRSWRSCAHKAGIHESGLPLMCMATWRPSSSATVCSWWFGVDAIYFLGDAVGYLPGPSVVEAVLAEGIRQSGITRRCCSPPGRRFRTTTPPAPVDGHGDDPALLESSGSLAVSREFRLGDTRAGAGPREPDGEPTFGYAYRQRSRSCRGAARTRDATVFMGNTHRPFVRRCGSTTFVNVGSCGLPRDVGTLGACCVFDERTGQPASCATTSATPLLVRCCWCGPFHEMVDEVLARRASSYVGEVVDV